MQTFDVIFQNDYHGQYSIVGQNFPTVAEAKKARQVSGDIVVYHNTTEIVRNTAWMWRNEVEEKSYAYLRTKKPTVKGVKFQ